MASPDYSNLPQAPLVFTATPDSIVQDNESLASLTQSVLDKVVAIPREDATFDNICISLITLENERQLITYPLDLCLKLSPNAAVRAAAADAEKSRAKFKIDSRSEDIFHRLDALYQRRDTLELHPEHLKWLIEEHRSYIRDGILLESSESRARYKEIKKRLADLVTDFRTNFNEETGPVCWFLPDELAGIPDDNIARFEKGTGEHEGKLKIDLSKPGNGVLNFCHNAATRKAVDAASKNKGQKNITLFEESVRLSREAAQILGYPSTAAYRLEVRMAKTPEAVSAFLNGLLERAHHHRHKGVAELLEIKQADRVARGLPAEDEIFSWDVSYYQRLQGLQQAPATPGKKSSEYFPIRPTVNNMLGIFGPLFGFVFVEISDEDGDMLSPTGKGSDLVWHEDVIMYNVWDDEGEGGGFRGYLYLDLYFREGKHRGYQCWPLNLGFEYSDGTRRYPSTVLMAIFPKPATDRPSLLNLHEVKLLFHELGHGIHDLSGASKCSRFFGAETVGDFNEAPSQMLEQWCFDPRGLKALSCHYETGERIPDSMIQSQICTKTTRDLWILIGMIRMALWDVEVYSAEGDVDLSEVYAKLGKLSGFKGPEDKHGYVQWRSLIHGGEASVYNYLWSKVHAMDMFDTAFRANPLDGAAGRHYRHMVLEKGASQDEIKTLTDFLGRDPNSEAYFRDLGLD